MPENKQETVENYEQQMKDSDMIFTQISTSEIDNFEEAEKLLLMYVMDMSISRAGISNARGRLKQYYEKRENDK